MSIAVVHSRASLGIKAPEVEVETHLSNGLPAFNLVGLPETAVRESKERVRSAILNSGFEFPSRRITVNLAPADLPKEGTRFDVAIALSILAASGQVPGQSLYNVEFVAELALTGDLRSVRGIMPAALAAAAAGRALVVARENCDESALVHGLSVFAATNLHTLARHLDGSAQLQAYVAPLLPTAISGSTALDLADIHGQHFAKRALEVAAAGGHNVLLSGPPGSGKTMLATRMPGLLPPLHDTQAFEVAVIASICGRPRSIDDWRRRPFRAPHHTCSSVALIGGGSSPKPGEVTLAHCGILFLDELPEFSRRALEVMREPLESGHVTISRAAATVEFPASFQLLATMNPCPCGYAGDPRANCACSQDQIRQYRSRLSGPLLDRIDIQTEVPRECEWLQQPASTAAESSHSVGLRVAAAQLIQSKRQKKLNARLDVRELKQFAPLNADSQTFLAQAFEHFRLTARGYHRLIKLARTIADLAGRPDIIRQDVAEALNLRRMDLTVPQR